MAEGEDHLALVISRCTGVSVQGQFERHTTLTWQGLSGSAAGGRWGPPGTFPVLYLARPRRAVVIEAYRHLVDPTEGMTGVMVQPRRLLTVEVAVTGILDLRDEMTIATLGFDSEHLSSPVGNYEPCWQIATAAYQLGLHGILAPAATGTGETLALFTNHLTAAETPVIVNETIWDGLPPDPRLIRLVDDETERQTG